MAFVFSHVNRSASLSDTFPNPSPKASAVEDFFCDDESATEEDKVEGPALFISFPAAILLIPNPYLSSIGLLE